MTPYLIPLARSWGYAPLNFAVRNVSLQKLASKTCSFDCSNAALGIPQRTRGLSDRVCKNKFVIFTKKDKTIQCVLYCHSLLCLLCHIYILSRTYVPASQKTHCVSLDLNYLQSCAVLCDIIPHRLPPIFHRNIVEFLPYYTTPYPRRLNSSYCISVTKPR
jgi:hypothetical protein